MIGFPACNTPYQFYLTCPLLALSLWLTGSEKMFCKLRVYWIVQDVAILKKKFKRTLLQYNFTVSSESFKNTDWLFDFERQDDTK